MKSHKTQTPKVKRVQIYYKDDTKKFLIAWQNKYKVSFSNILDKIIGFLLNEPEFLQRELFIKLKTEYLFDRPDMSHRTTLKPKQENWNSVLKDLEKTKLYTNLLYIYTFKKLKDYIQDDKRINQINQKIINELQKSREIFWNYNIQVRTNVRAIKYNKEYFKRLLNQYEQN